MEGQVTGKKKEVYEMVRLEELTMSMVMGILILLHLTGCSSEMAGEDIKSLKLGDKTITAGNHFRLSPVKYQPITLSGKDASANDFVFHCTLLSKERDIEYKGAVTFQASFSNGAKVTPWRSVIGCEKWPSGITQKDITITFILQTTNTTYSGEGFIS